MGIDRPPMLLVVENSPDSPLNGASEYLRENGLVLDIRKIHEGDGLPGDLDHAGLIVLGGSQAAFVDEGFPQRQAELRLIREAVDNNVPFLGVCLGAQLLAVACDSRAYPGFEREVGWTSIHVVGHENDELFGHWPENVRVMQWHQDHFELPQGAERFAVSSAYDNQIVRMGRAAWGVQFHLEVNNEYVTNHIATEPEWAQQAEGGANAILAETRHALKLFQPLQAETFRRFGSLSRERARVQQSLLS